ncbi:MAG: WD40/YVTN/BNR-like repeat-containing protein [Terriglobia bacterium]
MTRTRRPQPKRVRLLVGTRKGAFLFTSDLRRRRWRVEGPLFAGWEVHHLNYDPRSGFLYAAISNSWWGNDLQVSRNWGKSWRKASRGLTFSPRAGLSVKRIWNICPGRPREPGVLYAGVDPGALFRSENNAGEWYEVKSLTQHPTRKHWQPGAGGLMVHTILLDPKHLQRMYVGISAAGCFRSDDNGRSWQPLNRGVRADFLPNKFPAVGQCVHKMALDPNRPEVLYQQNHCGMYRSDDAAATWKDISRGLPSRFGFPIAVHPHESGTIYVVPEISADHRYVPRARFCVFRSRTGGKTWQKLTRGLPQQHAYVHVFREAMTTDQCEHAGIYLGTASGEIFSSRTAGNSWELLHAHLPSVFSLECVTA